MIPARRSLRLPGLACVLAIVVVVASALMLPAAGASSSPQGTIQSAWQLAQASGSYRFRSELSQTTTQAPSLRSAGRRPRVEQLLIDGRVNQADEELELVLWRNGAGNPNDGLSIKVADGRSFGRQGAGAWREIDGATDLFAPGGDPLGFLVAARDHRAGVSETREFDGAAMRFTRYDFRLDGPAFAELMRSRLERHLRERNELPPNLTVQSADRFYQMSGSGTLWVDDAGLPRRLDVQLAMPGQQGEQIDAVLRSDFLDFDRAHIVLATTPFRENPAAWLMFRLQRHAGQLHELAYGLVICFALAMVLMAGVSFWRSRPFHGAVVLAVIVSLLASPLLQAQRVASAAERLEARQAAQQDQLSRSVAPSEALAKVTASEIDPHAAPVVAGAALSGASSSDATDSDDDGLTDDEEASWGSCPSASSSSADCAGVASSKDSDADGIGDGVEVHALGINPAAADSDSDGISDGLEVSGFTRGGKTWYLDASRADSNGDGLIDSVDCPVWSAASSSYDAAGICPDTDGDQTPDIWDDDDDDDGVIDAVDLSPAANGGTRSGGDPLTLTLNSLRGNTPVFVDLQFRPTDTRHLAYITSILDWPSDDKGQIQRHLDTTFATTANTALASGDSNADYGDVRVIPMLEITMPAASGHYANLPVKPAFQGVTRPAGVAVDQWLDTDALDPYGISVRDIDTDTGELQAYVPLSVVTDDVGGGRVAYNARMLYWPSQTNGQGTVDWGSAQQYRVIWMVQMLTDACIDASADEATCARQDTLDIIHIYRDESWTISGLEVREDRGVAVTVLYEDPTADSDLTQDDDIWEASWNLHNTFLRGRDCGSSAASCTSDGARDVTSANLESSIHTWSGNTDAIRSRSFSYAHQGYLSDIMMTETVDLLGDVFTGVAGTTDPTLLFAREETYRSLNLQSLSATGGPLTFDLSSANAPEQVLANLSWATYRYENGGWANYDAAQNLDRLALQLAETTYFQPSGSDDDETAAEGKLIWAQFYSSAMAAGLSNLVSVGDATLWTPSAGDVPEVSYAPVNPAGLGTGASFVAYEYVTILSAVRESGSATSFWQNFSKGFTNATLTEGVRQSFKYGALAGNLIMTVTTSAVVTGLGLYLAGMLSGDDTLTLVGQIALTSTTVVIAMSWSVNVISTLRASTITGVSSAFSLAGPTRAIGPIGLVLGAVATWGLFLVQGITGGLFSDPTSVAFNSALASTVASTVVLLIMFMIDLIPFVGTLVVLAIMIADVLMSWFCKTTCHGGAQAWLTEVIADSLYDVNNVLKNLDSPDRLEFDITDVAFQSAEAGFTTANAISVTVQLTNTLRYGGSFADGDANRATFRYALQRTPTDLHDGLALGQMRGEWQGVSGRNIRTRATVSSPQIGLGSVGTGVNRDFEGKLYLTESYVGLYAGCWKVLGIDIDDCDFFPYSASNHIDVGAYIVYDILPTSLTSFVEGNWSARTPLPTPRDPDGDGLVSVAFGGADPDDTTWDSDGDGLSDEYELNALLDPAAADTDGDGLADLFEVRRDLNALVADADGDGLSDAQEQAGWRVGYRDQNNVQRYTWVWPDPFAADSDADNLNDLQEFYYGFHPGVATDSDAVLKTITFDSSSVTETNAPELLLRMEADAGAALFADSSGRGRHARCDESAGACPAGGVTGRYGYGATFDGNDYLELDDPSAATPTTALTLAAWVKLTSPTTNQKILGKGQSFVLGVASGRIYPEVWDSSGTNHTLSAGSIPANTWTHLALTWTSGGSLIAYINGAEVGRVSASGATIRSSGDTAVRVGAAPWNTSAFRVSGSLDDVAVFSRALAASEITALMGGRYNVDDGTVSPGDSVAYNLSIANNSTSWPVNATYYGELDPSDTGATPVAPLGEWQFSDPAPLADSSGNGYAATCSSCPTTGVAGYSGTAVQFDGVNDELVLDAAAQGWSGDGFSYGGWVYPTVGSNRYQMVFGSFRSGTGTATSDKLDFLAYDTLNQRFFEDTAGSSGSSSASPNQWHHVMVTIDPDSGVERLYLNGSLKATNSFGNTPVAGGRFRVSGPVYTQGVNTYYPFMGKIDGLTMYNRRLTQAEVAQIMAGTTTLQVPAAPSAAVYTVPVLDSAQVAEATVIPATHASGAYLLRQVVEAALDVTDETNSGSAAADPDATLQAHYDFDDPPGDSTISDSARRLGDASCAAGACPTMGIRGKVNRAALFDGADLVSVTAIDQYGAPYIGSSYTVAAWVKARNGILVEDRNGLKPFRLWTDRYDYRKYGGNLRSDYYGKTDLSYELPSATEWVHVAVTYNGSTHANAIYLNGALVTSPQASCCDDGAGGTHAIKIGQLLNGYIDDLRLYSRTMTASEVQTLYATSAPQLQLEFEEESGATAFEDSTSNGYDATIVGAGAGMPGRVGNGGYFDGTTYAQISSAPAIGQLTSGLSIMAWVNPTATGGTQRFIASGRTASQNGIGFGATDGKLTFSAFGVRDYISSASLTAGSWQHVAVVFDSSFRAKFYLNGAYVDTVAGTAAALANSDDPLYVGATMSGGAPAELFSGRLDELAVNNRALGDAEIERSYYNQFRWFRKQADTYLQVDADAPAIELLNGSASGLVAGYWPNSPVQLVVKASDPTSSIWSFEYGLTRPNASTISWQAAPRCAGSDTGLWCVLFDPTALGGEGDYLVRFRAVDAVGNQTTTDDYSIMVDGTAPLIAGSYDNTWLDLTPDPASELSWSVSLSGTVTDPSRMWSEGGLALLVPGDVDPASVAVTLLDSTGSEVGKGAQYATVTGASPATWQVAYTFVGTRPSGSYTVRVSAADLVGNTSTADVGTIVLDARPPSAELEPAALPDAIIGSGTVITGVLADQPDPAGAVVRLHFEEGAGATSFADFSGSGNTATCASCPTQVAGVFSQALQFDGARQTQLSVPLTESLDLAATTLAAWIRPTWAAGGSGADPAILGIRSGGDTAVSWHIRGDYSAIDLFSGEDAASIPVTIARDAWHHLALTHAGDAWTAYLDGALVGSAGLSTGGGAGTMLTIGASGSGGESFTGALDEVALYGRALSGQEIYALAQSQVSGAHSAEIGLAPFSPSSGAGEIDWHGVTLAQRGAESSTWSYTVPANLEGFYQIRLRGTDTDGNTGEDGVVWSGSIDTTAPRLTASAVQRYGGPFAVTEYTLVAEDLFIDTASIELPCDFELVTSIDEASGRVSSATATCSQPGHQATPVTMKICDYATNCAEQPVTPTVTRGEPALSFATPSTSVFTGTAAISLGGAAYAGDGIRSITISANGTPATTLNYPAAPAEAIWETIWTPPAPGSYTLTAVMTTAAGSVSATRTITIIPDLGSSSDVWLSHRVAPADARSGDVVTYTIALENRGGVAAAGTTVRLPLPATLSDAAFTAELDAGVSLAPVAGQSFAWAVGELAPGAGGTITVTARLSADVGAVVDVTATLESDGDFDATNNQEAARLAVVNRAPTIAEIPDLEVAEGTELTFAASGADTDLPAQLLSYSLAAAPDGARIDAATGVFSWTPSAAQGPGSYSVVVRVHDGELSADEALAISVLDRDLSYAVAADAALVSEGQRVTFTVARSGATDAASTVGYQLGGDVTVGSDVSGPISGTLQFAPGARSVSVTVETLDDDIAEGPETLRIELMDGTGPGGPVSYSAAAAQVEIADDDQADVVLSTTVLHMKAGAAKKVTVRLRSLPAAAVRVSFSGDAPEVCSVTESVELNETNWQSGVTITVTGIRTGACAVGVTIASDDPRYASRPTSPLYVTVETNPWHIYMPIVEAGAD